MSVDISTPLHHRFISWTRPISFLMALPLAAIMMVYPNLILDQYGNYSHGALTLIMFGICGGFVHGVGFIPKFWLWKLLFSPLISWPLMLLGYILWYLP